MNGTPGGGVLPGSGSRLGPLPGDGTGAVPGGGETGGVGAGGVLDGTSMPGVVVVVLYGNGFGMLSLTGAGAVIAGAVVRAGLAVIGGEGIELRLGPSLERPNELGGGTS